MSVPKMLQTQALQFFPLDFSHSVDINIYHTSTEAWIAGNKFSDRSW